MTLTGNVSRWFNRKGYGFINVLNSDSEHVGTDMFVHLSGINIQTEGYKCLYPGEYVSFDLDTGKDGRLTCVNVTGVLGGPLLVEHSHYRYNFRLRNANEADYGDLDTAHTNVAHTDTATDTATDATDATDAENHGD